MSFLRSRILAVLVVAFVFGGYSETVIGACDHHQPTTDGPCGEPSHSHSDEKGCRCVCHQTFVNELTSPPALAGASLEAELVFAELADIPPEGIPLGIDHPPRSLRA